MADSIRTQIIAALLTRAEEIRTANGFQTEIGTNVRLAKKPNKKLPAVVIVPGRESNAPEYGENILSVEVNVSGFMGFGDAEPELVSEKILADLIEAFSGEEIAYSFDSGSKSIAVGATLVGEMTGATCFVVGVEIDSGAWSSGNAAGTITVRRDNGLFAAGEFVQVDGENAATIAGATGFDSEALAAGGLAESIVYTEGGAEDWPEDGETVAGSSARFLILYRTKTGNPYSQN